MRENIGIYRGKRIDTGEWKEGYLLGVQKKVDGKDLFFIVDKNGEYHKVDPETIGEFTGMTDKDGTGIFEGDIVQWKKQVYAVKYFKSAFEFAIDPDEDFFVFGFSMHSKYKIIGNIHDDPELLGGADKCD